MRNPIFHMQQPYVPDEHRKLLREAIRQLDGADIYLAAVSFMDLRDREGQAELRLLRGDLRHLRQRFVDRRDRGTE
jgi:hypothetical protein